MNDKSKKHYERIQSKKKKEKEDRQIALDKEFSSAMKVVESISKMMVVEVKESEE